MSNEQGLLGTNSHNSSIVELSVNRAVVGSQQEVLLTLDMQSRSLELGRVIKSPCKLANLRSRRLYC